MPRNCPGVNCTSPPPEPPGLMRWDGSLEFGESANLYNFMWKAKSSSLDHHVPPLGSTAKYSCGPYGYFRSPSREIFYRYKYALCQFI